MGWFTYQQSISNSLRYGPSQLSTSASMHFNAPTSCCRPHSIGYVALANKSDRWCSCFCHIGNLYHVAMHYGICGITAATSKTVGHFFVRSPASQPTMGCRWIKKEEGRCTILFTWNRMKLNNKFDGQWTIHETITCHRFADSGTSHKGSCFDKHNALKPL